MCIRDRLSNFYLGQGDHNESPTDDCFYLYRQENAVKHLFRVAGGLDSMIVGETEILRQLKEAYELSEKNSASGKMFRHLFPEALKVGKKVRSSTAISEGCITPGQAALRLAIEILGDLDRKKALLMGSGTVAGLAAKAFIENNLRKFTVMNRTTESAEAMLEGLQGAELEADILPLLLVGVALYVTVFGGITVGSVFSMSARVFESVTSRCRSSSTTRVASPDTSRAVPTLRIDCQTSSIVLGASETTSTSDPTSVARAD